MRKLFFTLLLVAAASGAYLYAFPTASILYALIVVLHLVSGLGLAAVLVTSLLRRSLPGSSVALRVGWGLLALGVLPAILLIFTGTLRPYAGWLYAHIALSLGGVLLIVADWACRRWPSTSPAAIYAFLVLAAVLLVGGSWATRELYWQLAYRVANPPMPPASMDAEGDGSSGPFFPSSAQTVGQRLIPAKFFMESQSCKRCHAEIFAQWSSSAHRFSSFNNQWYRKSVEYMQDVAGVQPSKWCGGCHDPALLFTGLMDTPIREIIDRPESHAGLGCLMCHSIVDVKSSMGQGDYLLEYPALHEFVTAENPVVRGLHDFLVRLNPEPHRRTFLKPFMRQQPAEFCSTCHKVHLDVPVNRYRWIRGFNEYDNWQASGVSGYGARSFYYPASPQKCVDCHMPLTPAQDDGNIDGFVHSHRFPAANTAVPYANRDATQLEVNRNFLRDDIVSVDIFALSPALPISETVSPAQTGIATTFAVGEEAELALPAVGPAEATPVTAPLDRVEPIVRRGDTVRVDVVVRTRKVGHFFPGGTVDAFDVWVELLATDETGKVLFWSGMVEDEGKGPVEKGAHFYRALLVDAHGNPINKRNAWASRAVVYVRLIPPGAADTVHFRLKIPERSGEQIKLQARLHYRKFSWWNTHFSFAGERDPAQPSPDVTPHYDDGRWVFTGDTSKVSGQRKEIPNLPIVTLAEDEVTLRVAPRSAQPSPPRALAAREDWERWNDYGIGLFLQGDLKGAEAAFLKTTEADPDHPDGWVNLGRVRVREGNVEAAREVFMRALSLRPELARAHFFLAKVERTEGRYQEALDHLRQAAAQYPRDRVVRNEIGHILFLERRYQEAIEEFRQVLAIDPEDLQAHYNLMLCYTGLGQEERAREHQKRYLRFKADEPAQSITGPYLRAHPEDNRERQAIHEHLSVSLDTVRRAPPSYAASAPVKKTPVGSD